MPSLKKLDDWKPTGLQHRPRYSSKTIELIVETLPKRLDNKAKSRLAKQLDEAAIWFFHDRHLQSAPPPSKVRHRLEQIEAAARRLITHLGIKEAYDPDSDPVEALPRALFIPLVLAAERFGRQLGGYPDLPPIELGTEKAGEPYIDVQAERKMVSTLSGVQLIARWARNAQAQEADAVKSDRRLTGEGDWALNEFLARLMAIYREATEREPWLSRRGRTPTGPFLRFVKACLEPLAEEHTDQAIYERLKRVRRQLAVKPSPK